MMKRNLLTFFALATFGIVQAQTVQWDRDKFPDYNPTPRVNQKEVRQMTRRIAARKAEGKVRPDHWNNATTSAFPYVFNQDGGSCGSASRIGYMFTHEINAARGVSGKLAENIYPTHFTWLLTWVSNQGKEIIAQHNGVPNSVVYNGSTYSKDFGNQDCDDGQNNYGWMQGYDKWFHAMHNRISGSANFPVSVKTEEGRELVKNYLWNHCGDESYTTGGIVGIGVASSGTWKTIPKTDANDAAGVTGQYYVQNWGTGVDHALTVVGYDDRIEFDLDGNGIKGETDKDEVGAWIVVNSWGSGWCNNGFIYCPYAEGRPVKNSTDYWKPEYYTIRRNYRPLRTLKVTMDYDHRSEIALYVGVASNLNATSPEKETWLRHFYYSGLGKGATRNPAPAIPMLGKWADGELHSEPMEFGYDLTDLTHGFDTTQPLKYFFRVETESFAAGEGHIYSASILDYTLDREGVETPFEIADGGQLIANAGKKTTITTVARGESVPVPRNLAFNENTLTWEAPVGTSYSVNTYNIYKDNECIGSTPSNKRSTTVNASEDGTYQVSAVYRINGYDVESALSSAIIYGESALRPTMNKYFSITKGQFTVPAFTTGSQDAYTIEFWIKPRNGNNPNMGIKASSGKFLFSLNNSKVVTIGFDGGDYTTGSATSTLSGGVWQHVAIVVNGKTMKVYKNGSTTLISWTSGYNNSGINGANDLIFGKTEGVGNGTANYKQVIDALWNADIDELRIWNYARTQKEIKDTYKDTYVLPRNAAGLTHYYKMALSENADGTRMLVDALQQHDAPLNESLETAIYEQAENEIATSKPLNGMTATAAFSFDVETPTVGQPVTLTDQSSPSTAQWDWTFTGANVASSHVASPVVVFTSAGEQTVTLQTTNLKGNTAEVTKTITVQAASLPKPDFTIPAGTLKAGDHITFLNTTENLDACTYQWTLEGAENTDVRTTNAAATYAAYGTYKVKLTATNASGSKSVEKEITISKIAPSAAFTINNNIILAGEEITLLDASKYDPSSWTWTISNDARVIIVNGQNSTLKLTEPGVYNVSLKVANEIGQHTANRSRAVTVCNADGQTGLRFSATSNEYSDQSESKVNEVVAPAPVTATRSSLTIEWWMYPSTLTDACCGMGDSQSTFWMQANAKGALTVYKRGNAVTTSDGFIIDNEWHHYAVVYGSSKYKFYRDGIKIEEISSTGSIPAWEAFRMGGSEAPMNAIVDELRIWTKTFATDTGLRAVITAPIEDPENTQYLSLYYDFNQSSGDVIDRSANHLNGVRNNFGPDGDAWSSSKGIFFLNFNTTKAEDITSKYLKNYKASFAYSSATVNSSNSSRFKKLTTGITTSPWKQENSVVADGVTTEWHVDLNKGNYLTLSTTWDGFASEVKNLKLYQTITLPAGAYEFTATRGSWEWNPTGKYLVAAEGEGLPNYADLSSQALGYAQCGNICSFVLPAETTVSLGVVANQSGQSCHTIQAFTLKKKEIIQVDADEPVGIQQTEFEIGATATLQAAGGLGCIKITATEPQRVDIFDMSGRLVYSEMLEGIATVRARRGLYLVGGQKVLVR